MAFGSVTLTPGVNVERTPLALRSGISSSQLIRFRDQLVQKYGGWQRYFPVSVGGIPRNLVSWEDTNSNLYLGIGTTSKFAIISGGNLSDISPQTLLSNFAPNFSTVLGSNLVNVSDTNITNVTVNDCVFFNTPVTVGGIVLSGLYPIIQITGASSYEIQATTNATATVSSGGAVPTFTTLSGSSIVTVNFASHGLSVSNTALFQIPTTGNGVTISGAYTALTVPNANSFTVAVNSQATTSGTLSMNSGNAQINYIIALGPPPLGAGYGLGGYGLGGYGTGTLGSNQTGTDLAAANWTSGNWGSIVIMCPLNGGIYYWQPGSGFQTASLISAAPFYNAGIFISNTQQIVVAYGSSVPVGLGVQQQPLLVQWCDVSNFFQWTASSTTQAGNFVLSSGSKIVGGLAVANQNLLWTDIDLWAMNYVGPPNVFGFNKIGAGMGLAGPHAIQQLRGAIFWMGTSNFFVYSGGSPNVIPCPVWDFVFQNLNTAYIQNVCALPNTPFNEIGWAFPSLASVSGENDSYVKMNILEPGAPWDYGSLNRSAWIDQSVLGNPIGTSSGGVVYLHETTNDADGSPMSSSFTTGDFYMAEGQQFVFVDQVIPDFKWETFTGTTSAQIQVTFNVSNFPGDTPTQYGPYTVTSTTEYISTRFRGRLMSVTVQSSDLGSFWRLGKILYRYNPSVGRR